jgi:uncharacterized protein YjiS (DUF1127 family)
MEVVMTGTWTLHALDSVAQALEPAVLKCAEAVRKLVKARRNRSAIADLAHCEDRMLKDIGLSRSEVMGALAVRYNEDPSALLQRSAPSEAVLRVERSRASAYPQC